MISKKLCYSKNVYLGRCTLYPNATFCEIKSDVNRNIFASFNSDLNMHIGNKMVGVKKFGKM